MGTVILSIIIVMFIVETSVSVLNYRHRNAALPENVQGLYDDEKYQQWLSYTMTNFKFGLFANIVTTLLILGLLVFGFFGYLETLTQSLVASEILQVLLFLFGYYVINFVLGLPFSYYRVFVIEEKFGFNKMTKGLFVKDKVKNFLIMVIVVGGLLAALFTAFNAFSDNIVTFALIAYIGIAVVMLILFMFNGVFVRWFNKLEPLEEGTLKTAIDALGRQLGFEVKKIYTMDASKRSTKLNAFFSGIGKTKEVVLFDTLIAKLSEDEIVSVLAHELGHATHKDTYKLLVEQLLVIGLYVAILAYVLTETTLYTSFGLGGIHFGFALILMTVLLSPVGVMISTVTNYMSRVMEYKADAFAVKHTSKEAMSGALKKLVTENFANLTPHPLYEALNYNHPNISKRLEAIENVS